MREAALVAVSLALMGGLAFALCWVTLRRRSDGALRIRVRSKAAATPIFVHEFEFELLVPGLPVGLDQVQRQPSPSDEPHGTSSDIESQEGGEGL
jgi:hypothetical protein